jgi:hypothetical protein
MPDLQTSLRDQDLGFIRMIAEHWGIELHAPDAASALRQLIPLLCEPELLHEIIETLPQNAREGLRRLLQAQGRMSWSQFTRQFGEIREMGPGRRDRERPDRSPISAAENLWYHALINRNTFMTPTGTQLMAYIPDEFLALLPVSVSGTQLPLGRKATPAESAYHLPANDWVLDDACTLLAWLRTGQAAELPLPPAPASEFPWAIKIHQFPALYALIQDAGLVDASHQPVPERIKDFLEGSRGAGLAHLAQSWLQSNDIDELGLIPNLGLEGEWEHSSQLARQQILNWLADLPANTWWNLPAFIAGVKSQHPHFLRPAGNFETWYIRDLRTDRFLIGFEHWESVEGALIHYLITGPLHWLGLIELASTAENTPISAFRRSGWWPELIDGHEPSGLPQEDETFLISSDGRLRTPRLVPRPARYQAARFAVWEDAASDGYRYRITPDSLEQARQQGLEVGHLIALLRRFALTVPPSLVRALERLDQVGVEARLEQALILRVSSPEILQALRQSRAARFLGDPLGPTAIILRPNAGEKVLSILAELGYLGESTLINHPGEANDKS